MLVILLLFYSWVLWWKQVFSVNFSLTDSVEVSLVLKTLYLIKRVSFQSLEWIKTLSREHQVEI